MPDPVSSDAVGSDPTRRGRVLVTGASIAGPTAAYWLSEAGYDVTVLERVQGTREGGQNVDVRGLAKEVLERMGIREAVQAAGTGEVGTRFVDDDGGTVSEFPADAAGDGDGPTAELEVLRGELARVVRQACGDRVTFASGDQVTGVEQDDSSVTVHLDSGTKQTYDLLVVAEGAGSRTRDLVFVGDEAAGRDRLGMFLTYATIPRTERDDDWWNWLAAPRSRMVSLRPDNQGTTRVMLGFMDDPVGYESLPLPAQKQQLRERFGDLGWETPRVLDAVDDLEDLYAEDLAMVKAPTWRHGRVVLLGDAAWCVTPLGGAGTSLALVGGYVLAAEVARADADDPGHPEAGLAAYEAWMRPLVDERQDLPPGTPRVANPRTRLGVALFRAGTRLAATGPVQSLVGRFLSFDEPDRALPAMPGPGKS